MEKGGKREKITKIYLSSGISAILPRFLLRRSEEKVRKGLLSFPPSCLLPPFIGFAAGHSLIDRLLCLQLASFKYLTKNNGPL